MRFVARRNNFRRRLAFRRSPKSVKPARSCSVCRFFLATIINQDVVCACARARQVQQTKFVVWLSSQFQSREAKRTQIERTKFEKTCGALLMFVCCLFCALLASLELRFDCGNSRRTNLIICPFTNRSSLPFRSVCVSSVNYLPTAKLFGLQLSICQAKQSKHKTSENVSL